jgi:K+ transporter
VVTVKYVLFAMGADNHGEDGVIALMALAGRRAVSWERGAGLLLGLVGVAADGVIIASGHLRRVLAHATGIQLGYLPRMSIRHTSEEIRGQIYLPAFNWLL